MAAFAPASIGGALGLIGTKMFDLYKSNRQKEGNRKTYMEAAGHLLSAPEIDDPTGLGGGKGRMYNASTGDQFFMPSENSESILSKLQTGEYLPGHQAASGATQRGAAYRKNPSTGVWEPGNFAGDSLGGQAFNSQNWTAGDIGSSTAYQQQAALAASSPARPQGANMDDPNYTVNPYYEQGSQSGQKQQYIMKSELTKR